MAEALLKELAATGHVLEGDFRPGATGREWCDPDVLQTIRRRSLAKLRHQVEPVEPSVLGRLVTNWQGVVRRRTGLDALLDSVETLQGAPLVASILESEILPARIDGYNPADLDALTAAGEILWAGLEPLGERDGRLALYLTDHFPKLHRLPGLDELPPRERAIVDYLRANGASFFSALHDAAGGGYPAETVDAIWSLVWRGALTNDTFHALRAFTRPPERRTRKARPSGTPAGRVFRSRRLAPPAAEGRWSLLSERIGAATSPTESAAALAQQLLSRYGVLSREVAGAEGIAGGFSAVYHVLKTLEDAGRIRRGYFASGVGATQFALPAALDLLRSLKDQPDAAEVVVLSATDPANPYGTILRWPESGASEAGRNPTRSVGSVVVLVNGAMAAYISRGARQLTAFLPEDEPARSTVGRALATRLAQLARGEDGRMALLIAEINGVPASEHPLALYLVEAGFSPSAMGFQIRRAVTTRGA
jgi:ATP-dependent helicase Lhr and Lhr-like helicase